MTPLHTVDNGDISPDLPYPAEIELTIGYYQKNATSREVIQASLSILSYTSSPDNYTLILEWHALPWLDLMNSFSFDMDLYVVLYIICGLAQIIATVR